jgi:hypothetical protein
MELLSSLASVVGYHVRFTRERSPVRTRCETLFLPASVVTVRRVEKRKRPQVQPRRVQDIGIWYSPQIVIFLKLGNNEPDS